MSKDKIRLVFTLLSIGLVAYLFASGLSEEIKYKKQKQSLENEKLMLEIELLRGKKRLTK